jgi:hypothetical protein
MLSNSTLRSVSSVFNSPGDKELEYSYTIYRVACERKKKNAREILKRKHEGRKPPGSCGRYSGIILKGILQK